MLRIVGSPSEINRPLASSSLRLQSADAFSEVLTALRLNLVGSEALS